MRKTSGAFALRTVEENNELLKIGEVARESGIGIEALRFYERSGLLERPVRNASGYRMYRRDVLIRLEFIKRAQVLGFSLHEIKELIAHKQAGMNPCAEVRSIVRRRLAELDERMKEIKQYRRELAETLAEWDAQGEAEGHVCGLIETARLKNGIPAAKAIGRKPKNN